MKASIRDILLGAEEKGLAASPSPQNSLALRVAFHATVMNKCSIVPTSTPIHEWSRKKNSLPPPHFAGIQLEFGGQSKFMSHLSKMQANKLPMEPSVLSLPAHFMVLPEEGIPGQHRENSFSREAKELYHEFSAEHMLVMFKYKL